jgi:hypothetical protein
MVSTEAHALAKKIWDYHHVNHALVKLLPPPKIQEIIEGVVNVHYPKKSKFS